MGPFVLRRVAGLALARNKMRTALAALGIIIGVGAVICTVSSSVPDVVDAHLRLPSAPAGDREVKAILLRDVQ